MHRTPRQGAAGTVARVVASGVVVAVMLAACGAQQRAPSAGDVRTSTSAHPDTTGQDTAASAPAIDFETFEGQRRSLADFHEDAPLVVNFWASWCPPCVSEMPDIEAVHDRFEGEVNVLGINTQDKRRDAAELAAETGVTYPLGRDPDGQLFRAFSVFGMPTTFFITSDGRIVERHTGVLTEDALIDKVRHLLETST